MKKMRWTTFALLLVALAGGAGILFERQSAAALRSELALLQEERQHLSRLQADNDRLRAGQPKPEDLARLRADRAALHALRPEIEKLKTRVKEYDAANGQAGPRD